MAEEKMASAFFWDDLTALDNLPLYPDALISFFCWTFTYHNLYRAQETLQEIKMCLTVMDDDNLLFPTFFQGTWRWGHDSAFWVGRTST